MAVFIPEILIINTLNQCLSIIRDNHNNAVDSGHEERSLLYLLFNTAVLGKYDLYANAKQLLLTTPESPLHLEVRLGYDHTSAFQGPSIFLMTSSENDRNNSTQIGEGDFDELKFEGDDISDQDLYIKQYTRRYLTTCQVVFVTQNRNELSVLYTLFKSIITSCINHLAVQGVENLKIGGQDLRLNTSVPERIFSKSITLSFEYEQTVPEIFTQLIFRKLQVYLLPDGAETPIGPIAIDGDESF